MDFMKAQSADGGGDEPEGVDAAMEVAIGKFKWREDVRAIVMFLVLMPHLTMIKKPWKSLINIPLWLPKKEFELFQSFAAGLIKPVNI